MGLAVRTSCPCTIGGLASTSPGDRGGKPQAAPQWHGHALWRGRGPLLAPGVQRAKGSTPNPLHVATFASGWEGRCIGRGGPFPLVLLCVGPETHVSCLWWAKRRRLWPTRKGGHMSCASRNPGPFDPPAPCWGRGTALGVGIGVGPLLVCCGRLSCRAPLCGGSRSGGTPPHHTTCRTRMPVGPHVFGSTQQHRRAPREWEHPSKTRTRVQKGVVPVRGTGGEVPEPTLHRCGHRHACGLVWGTKSVPGGGPLGKTRPPN